MSCFCFGLEIVDGRTNCRVSDNSCLVYGGLSHDAGAILSAGDDQCSVVAPRIEGQAASVWPSDGFIYSEELLGVKPLKLYCSFILSYSNMRGTKFSLVRPSINICGIILKALLYF